MTVGASGSSRRTKDDFVMVEVSIVCRESESQLFARKPADEAFAPILLREARRLPCRGKGDFGPITLASGVLLGCQFATVQKKVGIERIGGHR
jgi:hypothetical protein